MSYRSLKVSLCRPLVVIQRTNTENNIGASLLKVTGQQFGANIATPFTV